MKSRRWAKYVAVLLMMALVVPGVFLMANAIEAKQERDEALEADREAACASMTERLVEALDTFTQRFEGLSALGSDKVPPMPSMEQLRVEAETFDDQLASADCPKATARAALDSWRDEPGASGTLAGALRSALAANVLDVLAGGAEPPRVTMEPGEDLATAVSRLPAGATLVLPAGRFDTAQTVVVVQDLTIEGAGSGSTTVASSAGGAGVLLASPVALRISGLSLRHTGGGTSSLLVLRAGDARVEDAHLSGATLASHRGNRADEALLAGGSGIVVAGARRLQVVGSTAVGNEVAGVVAAGPTEPEITGGTFSRNGVCGICYVGQAGGTLRDSTLTGNGAGVMLGDRAAPLLEVNRIDGNDRAGIVLERLTHPVVRSNIVSGNGSIGIAVYGSSSPKVLDNTVRGHRDAGVLVDVAAAARPRVAGNRFTRNRQASLVYAGRSAGLATRNSCSGSRFQLVLAGSSAPRLRGNACSVHDQRR